MTSSFYALYSTDLISLAHRTFRIFPFAARNQTDDSQTKNWQKAEIIDEMF